MLELHHGGGHLHTPLVHDVVHIHTVNIVHAAVHSVVHVVLHKVVHLVVHVVAVHSVILLAGLEKVHLVHAALHVVVHLGHSVGLLGRAEHDGVKHLLLGVLPESHHLLVVLEHLTIVVHVTVGIVLSDNIIFKARLSLTLAQPLAVLLHVAHVTLHIVVSLVHAAKGVHVVHSATVAQFLHHVLTHNVVVLALLHQGVEHVLFLLLVHHSVKHLPLVLLVHHAHPHLVLTDHVPATVLVHVSHVPLVLIHVT